jgi:virulence factor Mce-like protein
VLQESKWAKALLGLLLSAAVVAVVYTIVLSFTGHFTNVAKVTAQLPAGSNAVPVGAPVEYRNVTVGTVSSEGLAPNGGAAVQLKLYPAKMAAVPSGVRAQVAPLSIFGNQYVNLVPPPTIGAAHLEAGTFIAPYGGAPSTSLQGTVTQLYSLLHAVHPAELDTALSALASALNGEGTNLGHTLSGASTYLNQAIVPNLATVQSDLKLIDPVSQEVVNSTPNLLGVLSNSTVTARTITDQQAELHTLLSSGRATVKQLADILGQVRTTLPSLLNESGPLLADVTQNPNELSQTLSGLTQFASAVAAAESHGPYLSVNANLPVVDISAGVNAALGYNNPTSLAQALGSAFDPPTYTGANCPEYPGASNPYCGVGGSPDAAPVQAASVPLAAGSGSGSGASGSQAVGAAQSSSSPASAGTAGGTSASPTTPYASELAAAQAIAAALNGGQAPPSPGLAAIVLYPLLSSMAGNP